MRFLSALASVTTRAARVLERTEMRLCREVALERMSGSGERMSGSIVSVDAVTLTTDPSCVAAAVVAARPVGARNADCDGMLRSE